MAAQENGSLLKLPIPGATSTLLPQSLRQRCSIPAAHQNRPSAQADYQIQSISISGG